ncbi:MAG: hypothetical protein HY453_00990 [Parcubacteria group bacterium]|nr:hypothetical protein [Parcubacteria group bacterium]
MTLDLKDILDLMRRNGDTIITYDESSEMAFAIVPLTRYAHWSEHEKNIENLTEQELLMKINADIARWKVTHEASRREVVRPEAGKKQSERSVSTGVDEPKSNFF